jgi:hypothetical protein
MTRFRHLPEVSRQIVRGPVSVMTLSGAAGAAANLDLQ